MWCMQQPKRLCVLCCTAVLLVAVLLLRLPAVCVLLTDVAVCRGCVSDAIFTLCPPPSSSQVIKAVLKQVMAGVMRLHALGIVHRELQPDHSTPPPHGELPIPDMLVLSSLNSFHGCPPSLSCMWFYFTEP